MFVSGSTLTQSSSGQYKSTWLSVGRYVRAQQTVTSHSCQKNAGAVGSFTWHSRYITDWIKKMCIPVKLCHCAFLLQHSFCNSFIDEESALTVMCIKSNKIGMRHHTERLRTTTQHSTKLFHVSAVDMWICWWATWRKMRSFVDKETIATCYSRQKQRMKSGDMEKLEPLAR